MAYLRDGTDGEEITLKGVSPPSVRLYCVVNSLIQRLVILFWKTNM